MVENLCIDKSDRLRYFSIIATDMTPNLSFEEKYTFE